MLQKTPLTTLQWSLIQPSIRFDLTELQTTNKSDYVQHIRILLHEYPDYITCFTDGSKSKNRTSYAYSINGDMSSHRTRNIASIFSAELIAISSCLTHISQLPPNGKFILFSDSLSLPSALSLTPITPTHSSNEFISYFTHLTQSTPSSRSFGSRVTSILQSMMPLI